MHSESDPAPPSSDITFETGDDDTESNLTGIERIRGWRLRRRLTDTDTESSLNSLDYQWRPGTHLGHDNRQLTHLTPRTVLSLQATATRRNLTARRAGAPPLFKRPLTAGRLARYQYLTLRAWFSEGAYVPEPIDYRPGTVSALLITDPPDDVTPAETDQLTSNHYLETLQSVRLLHDQDCAHGGLHQHPLVCSATGHVLLPPPYLKPNPDAFTHVQAFDLGCLLAHYGPIIGAMRLVETLDKYYPPAVLKAIPTLEALLQRCTPHLPDWIANQVTTAVDQFAEG